MQTKLFGCKVNAYYLNQRLNYFIQNPTSHNLQISKTPIIIASCEVTDRAKKKYIKEITTHAQDWKTIYLTGCGSIQKWEIISEQNFYSRYPKLKKFQKQITLLPESPPTKISKPTNQQISEFRTRKPIVIQTGCDNFCTFCLTVHKRGAHNTRPAEEIINEINIFQDQGGKEIVLTWINLAARGCDTSRNPQTSKFSQLLQKIIDQTTIPRIRISSLWPEYLDDQFFEIIQNPRFMPHFHLSIQSFSDNILQKMKRNYTTQTLDKTFHKFQLSTFNSQLSLGADIIIGFPDETEADFQITLNALAKYNITKLHSFPFSAHHFGQTVPASLLPNQIDPETKKIRQQKILTEWKKIREKFIQSQQWKQFKVLLEQQKNTLRHGWTPNYIPITIKGNYQKNQIISYKL